MKSATVIRVLLVDDHELVRAGVRRLLSQAPTVQVVGEASDGPEALRLVDSLQPDVVLVDITLPGVNGIDMARQVTRQHPAMRVVGLSMHSRRAYVQAMLEAGAIGYVTKQAKPEVLLEAVQWAAQGRRYLDPHVAAEMVETTGAAADRGDASAGASGLSPREREVLQLTAEGRSAKEIALKLGLSVRTVAFHRQSLMNKLGVDSVAGLTRYAIRAGLTPL